MEHAFCMKICYPHEAAADPQRPRRRSPAPQGPGRPGGEVDVGVGSGRAHEIARTPDPKRADRTGPGSGARRRLPVRGRRGACRTRRAVIVLDASAAVEWLLDLPLAGEVTA